MFFEMNSYCKDCKKSFKSETFREKGCIKKIFKSLKNMSEGDLKRNEWELFES